MNITDAIDIMESISGVTDESTPVGDAWNVILRYIHNPTPERGKTTGPSKYEWKDIGDGQPVRVRRCHKCGVCPSNVDDCGRFGDSRCPFFGIDALAILPFVFCFLYVCCFLL